MNRQLQDFYRWNSQDERLASEIVQAVSLRAPLDCGARKRLLSSKIRLRKRGSGRRPVKKIRNEDLFQDTTMTFGEHLEELRSSLFKALVGLIAGFGIGLYFGDVVVRAIQTPLTSALQDYYVTQAKLEASARFGEDISPEIQRAIDERGLLPEEVYVRPGDVAEALKGSSTGPAPPAVPNEGEAAQQDFTPLMLWRNIEYDQRLRPQALGVQEAFMIYVKAALLTGFVVASPWIFYQIWSFVAAGLYPHEKHYVHLYIPFSIGLFLLGASTAFFFVFEPVLKFLFGFNQWLKIDPDPKIGEWLGFVLMLPLGFGAAFQLPLIMLFLERIGIFDVRAYLEKWRVAILAIFIISAVLTPADPYSMLLMAVPLTFLYFGGIGLCRWLPSHRNPFEETA